MMLKNAASWKNGTIATLLEYDEDEQLAVIEIEDQAYEIGRETWRVLQPSYDEETKKIVNNEVGSFTQMPFKLARAITIHKAQ